MNRDPVSPTDRKRAVRALLASLPGGRPAGRAERVPVPGEHGTARSRASWVRPVAAMAIAVVFALVAYFGLTAAHDGTLDPATTSSPTPSTGTDEKTVAVGTVIGSWSSDAKPVSYGGTVSTGGLAIATTVTCSGPGSLAISLSHVSDQDGSCGDGKKPQTSRDSGGITKPVVVKIRPHGGRVTWRVTLRAVAPTTFTPVPVRAKDGQGRQVPYCTSDALSATYVHVPEPLGVNGTTTGEIVVTNTGGVRCAASGYPAASFVSALGATIGHPARNRVDTKNYSTRRLLAPVLLQPGGHAYVQVDAGHAADVDACRPETSKALRFTSDNDGFSTPVTYTVAIPATQACSDPKALQLFATIYVDYPADLRTPAQITAAATCRLDELAIRLRSTPDQAGEQTGAVAFTNTGARSCHLNGTPALRFLTDAGTPTGRPTGVRLHGGDPDVLDAGYEVLARGDTVYVHYAIQKSSAVAACRPTSVHRIRTTTGEFGYPTTIDLPAPVRACTNAAATQLRATGFITDRDYRLNSLPKG